MRCMSQRLSAFRAKFPDALCGLLCSGELISSIGSMPQHLASLCAKFPEAAGSDFSSSLSIVTLYLARQTLFSACPRSESGGSQLVW
jgi:hypothetical protein